MIINKYFAIVVLTLLSAPAFAQVKCTAFEVLDKNTESCEDNSKFLNAGKECLQKLEALISTTTGVAIDKIRKATPSDFKKKKLSSDQKNVLLASARHVKTTLHKYKVNIYYPEDFDAPEEVIGDNSEFVRSQPCYADNLAGLEELEIAASIYAAIFK